MYEYIKAKVVQIGAGYIVLEHLPWGIKVFVLTGDLVKIKVGEEIKLYLYKAKYDDRDDLYGFLTQKGREIFLSMLKVPGIGAKVSYMILSSLGEERVLEAVEKKDSALLSKAKGVGKKKASMIILQLKGVLQSEVTENKPSFWNDAYKALLSMGYKDKEIEKAFERINIKSESVDNVAELVRLLLKEMKI